MSSSLKTLVGAGLFVVSLLAAPGLSAAKDVTVTLSVPGMDCPMCPITVRMSLEKVDGVLDAKTSLEARTAVVTFDDAKTNVPALIEATTNYGYPSVQKLLSDG
ncbi:MAG: mercury resistance system periplasmic binding protein MerP [Cognatishimia sp.]|uniref:mercury resistance system periplasmic binding protein MerP n=1 Tax=Cognatishimia sp. TaxID=2211648 RepID=UPI0040583F9D